MSYVTTNYQVKIQETISKIIQKGSANGTKYTY